MPAIATSDGSECPERIFLQNLLAKQGRNPIALGLAVNSYNPYRSSLLPQSLCPPLRGFCTCGGVIPEGGTDSWNLCVCRKAQCVVLNWRGSDTASCRGPVDIGVTHLPRSLAPCAPLYRMLLSGHLLIYYRSTPCGSLAV